MGKYVVLTLLTIMLSIISFSIISAFLRFDEYYSIMIIIIALLSIIIALLNRIIDILNKRH
ncbi:hypothetical protein ACQCT6_02680 [Cytobacillus gottheilii]|uniref:Uncharacterized protein n=2 Tax=Cytobacillus gottheilii TaxID=859144 RepID=A0ABX8F7M2_9BACI|nr:hypothetical protein [Cytobacillus gottheilii]QVY60438.1 hypothetical protein J1899_15650 [Cytobacillus gottheilii]